MSNDINDMIDNPEKYGFAWGYGELCKGKTDRTVIAERAPFMEHVDVAKIRDTFGDDYVLGSMNGTSRRVVDQRLRNDIIADRSLAKDDRAMKEIIIRRAIGVRKSPSRVTVVTKIVQKFAANDGTLFDTLVETMAHNKLLEAERLITE